MDKNNTKKGKLPLFYQAVGRRKTATARVRLYPAVKKVTIGELILKGGDILINHKPITQYFQGEILAKQYLEPLTLTDNVNRFAITALISGSGLIGQLGALTHGISRALIKVDKDKFRSVLKKNGLLTRDPRMKERRKPGLAGKARAGKQSPKR